MSDNNLMKFCPDCGTQRQYNSNFCGNCGLNFKSKASQVAKKHVDQKLDDGLDKFADVLLKFGNWLGEKDPRGRR